MYANSGEFDTTPLSLESGLGLHCLPTSDKKDARLMWVKDLSGSVLVLSHFASS